MDNLVYNAIRTPDGTTLISTHRHDYKEHRDANGETYIVDGGLDYRRCSINKEKATDLALTLEDPHEKIRETVTWGTYGKDGNGPLRYVAVKNLEDEHLEALIDLDYVYPSLLKVFANELEYRKSDNKD